MSGRLIPDTAKFPSAADGRGSGAVRVRDLWARRDIGEATAAVRARVEGHGATLLRLAAK